MSVPAAKTPGGMIRICRKNGDATVIECDWTLARIEPETGNAIAERDGKRITCPRNDFESLNFPGSDEVWNVISADHRDGDLEEAESRWAAFDLPGVKSALLNHARKLNPAFAGIQTVSDLHSKIENAERTLLHQADVLRLEARRAHNEYNRCSGRTGFDNDQKDTLLSRWRDIEDRLATRRYCCDKLLPLWKKMADVLDLLEATTEKMRQTSP